MHNDHSPKVSIMIPVYNHEEFIEDCLDSILSQDYSNLEIVVADDYSIDGTRKILEKYKSNKQVVLLLNEKNLGITENTDQALKACTGEFIALFAGDDIMLPNKIKDQVLALEGDRDAAFCYHRVEIFDSETGKTIVNTEKVRSIFTFFDVIEKIGIPGSNSVMVRRNNLPHDGYNKTLPNVSDWMLFIDISLRGKIIFLDKIYSKYRKHNKGASMLSYKFLDETYETLEIIKNRFNHDKRISKSCRKAWFRYLVGEVARLLNKDDYVKIREINYKYIKNQYISLSFLVAIYLKLRIYRLNFGKHIYTFMSNIKNS